MRRLVWSLMSVAALALAGCNNSSQSSGGAEGGDAAQTPAQANQITGQVTLRDAATVSPNAKLDLTLVDVSTQDAAPLASKTIQTANTLPLSFQLPISTPS